MLHIETQPQGGSSSAIVAAYGSATTSPNGAQDAGVANIGAYGASGGVPGGGGGGAGGGGGPPSELPLTSPTIPQHYSSQPSPNHPPSSAQAHKQQQLQAQQPQQQQISSQMPIPPHLKQPSPHSNSSSSSPSSFSGTFSAAPEGSFNSAPTSVNNPYSAISGPSQSQQQHHQQQQQSQHHHPSLSNPSPSQSFNPSDFNDKNTPNNPRSHSVLQQQQKHQQQQQQQQQTETADRYKAAAAMMSFEVAANLANRGVSQTQHSSALNDDLLHNPSNLMNGGGSSVTDSQGAASVASPSVAGAKSFQHPHHHHHSQQQQHHPPEPFANGSVGAVAAKTTPSMGWPPFTSPEKAPSEMLSSPPVYLNASASRSSSATASSTLPESSYSTASAMNSTVIPSTSIAPSSSSSTSPSSTIGAAGGTASPHQSLNPSSSSTSLSLAALSPLSHPSSRTEREIQQEAFYNQLQQQTQQRHLQQQQQQQQQQSTQFSGGSKTVTSSSSSSTSAFNESLPKDASSAFLSQMHQMAHQFLTRDKPETATEGQRRQQQPLISPAQDLLHPPRNRSSPPNSPPLPPPPTHATVSPTNTLTTSSSSMEAPSSTEKHRQSHDSSSIPSGPLSSSLTSSSSSSSEPGTTLPPHPPSASPSSSSSSSAHQSTSGRPFLKSLKDRIVTQMLEGRVTADEAVAAASGDNATESAKQHRSRAKSEETFNPHEGGSVNSHVDAADQVRASFAAQMAAAHQQLALQQQQRERRLSAGGGCGSGDEKLEPKREPKREPSTMEEMLLRPRSPSAEQQQRRRSEEHHRQQQQQQQQHLPRGERRPSLSDSVISGEAPGGENVTRVEIDKDGKKIYICNICQFSDDSKVQFHNHLATHFNEKCPLCDYTTTSPQRLKNHMQHFHPGKMRAEDFDDDEDEEAMMEQESSLALSQFGPGGEGMEPQPGDSLLDPGSPSSVAAGMDGAVSPGVASSGSGSDRLSSIPSLQALQAAAASQAVPPEEDTFLQQASQITTTASGRPKVFRCKQCSFVGQTKISFWQHSRVHIKPEKLLACPKCPFVTEYKHHLEYHLRNHFGSKPFKCSKCNYSCVNLSMLRSHLRSHSNIYQYRCADCTYATKYCHSLKLHLRKYNHKPATMLNSAGNPQPLPPELSSHIPGMPGSPGGSPPGFGGPLSPGVPCPSSPRSSSGSTTAFGNKSSPRKRLDMLSLPGGIPLPPHGEHPGAAAAAAFWQHHIAASQGMNPLLMNGGHPHLPPSHLMIKDRPFSPRGDGEHREAREASHAREPSSASRDPSTSARETASRDPMPRDPMTRDPMTRDPMSRDPMSRDPMSRDPLLHDRQNSPMKAGETDRFQPNGRPKSPKAGATGSPVAKCKLCDYAAPTKEALGKHMLVHAAENNKDLCNLYGFSSDSFSENGNSAAEGEAKRAALSASASHQLEAEKQRLALMHKLHPDGKNGSSSSSVFGERNQTEVLSQVIAKYTENAASQRFGAGANGSSGSGIGATKSPPTPSRERKAAEEAAVAARKNAFNLHHGGPPRPPSSTSTSALAAAAAVLHGGAAAAANNAVAQRHPGPPHPHDPKMMSPGGLFQLQQHLQQQLMFAAAAGIQPNPTLLAQALQAQAAYAAAAAAHGRGMQPPEVPSPASTRSPAGDTDKRGRSPSPETRSPSSRPRSVNVEATSPPSGAATPSDNGVKNDSGDASPRVGTGGGSGGGGGDGGALDLSCGMDSREGSPNSDRSNPSSVGSAERSRERAAGSGGPPKKRPRKGQALHLDQISARLQQRGGASDDEDNGGDDENGEGSQSRPASTSAAAAAGSSGGNGRVTGLSDIHDSLAELNNERGEQRWLSGGRDRRTSDDVGAGRAASSETASAVDVGGSPAESWDESMSPRNGRDGRDGSGSQSPSSPRAIGGSGKRKSSIIKRYDKQQQNGASSATSAANGENGNGNNNNNNNGGNNSGNDDNNHGSPSPAPSARSTPPNSDHRVAQETAAPEAVPKSDESQGKMFECAHCDMSFRNCVMYSVHMGFHGYQDPFHCNMCGESFKDKVEFFLHIGRVAHR